MFIARSWSATSTPSVFPFRLLNNHFLEMTVSMRGLSTILGYWSCSALFFYFSSFMDLILDLNMCFWALAFSEAHSYSLFSNPGIVTSLLNLVVFLDVEFFYFRPFMLKHLLWILPFFVPPGDDWALLLLFWMLFLHQSGTFLHLLLRCIIIIIIIIILNVNITIIGRLKPGWHNTLNGGERNLQQVSRSVRAWVVLSLSNYNRQHI